METLSLKRWVKQQLNRYQSVTKLPCFEKSNCPFMKNTKKFGVEPLYPKHPV